MNLAYHETKKLSRVSWCLICEREKSILADFREHPRKNKELRGVTNSCYIHFQGTFI